MMLNNNLMNARLFADLTRRFVIRIFNVLACFLHSHRELNLRQPIYQSTSCYGHFGRAGFAWEEAKPLNYDCLKALNGNGEHA